jgi:ABC-type amino acid transport substrate-binding protein
MKRRIAFVCALLVAAALVSTAAGEKTVRLVSLDWPPYIGSSITDGSPSKPNNGYVAELVVEAYKRMGYKVVIDFKPWARALEESTNGLYDGLFPEYYGEERKTDFIYSNPFPGGPVGLMKRKDFKFTYTSLKDLKGYTVGVVTDYINTAEFDAATHFKKEAVVDDETNIRKLYAKRVDFIFIDKYVALDIIRTKYPEYEKEFEFIELEVKPLYIVFSKKAAGVQAKLNDFNAGLAAITKDGTVKAILAKHGFGK